MQYFFSLGLLVLSANVLSMAISGCGCMVIINLYLASGILACYIDLL